MNIITDRLMAQFFAGWRLTSSSSVVVCNAAGLRAGRVGGRAADTAVQYGYVPLVRHLVLFD